MTAAHRAAWLGSLAAFSCLASCDQPPAEGQTRTYVCYTRPGEPSFSVEFRPRGAIAILSYAGRAYRLALAPRRNPFSMDETYRGDGVTLTLDPEANVTGLTPDRLGPCE
jgi:hypothetical protein